MEGKKIAFGFTKTIKKLQFPQNNKTESLKTKVELITCLEGKEIKLVNEKEEEKPLVIQLKNSSKTSKALESLKMRKAVLEGIEIDNTNKEKNNTADILSDIKLDSLERRAITELLVEARSDFNGSGMEETSSKLTIVVKPEDLPLDGAKEPTTDDYESIPIDKFGMAMLRGMGLKEEIIKKKSIDDDILVPRPKGMGLGADKAIKRQAVLIPPEENEKLEIKKNAYIKMLAGKYKSQYGIIEGLDDRTGRVNVKLALGGTKESLGEYLVQPVSKKEYQTYGKVINSEKYDEYKKKQNENEMKMFVKEESQIKREVDIKIENDDRKYDKYNSTNSKQIKSSKYSSDNEEEYKPDLKIKLEKTDEDKSNSRSNSKYQGSTSRRYSSESEEHSKSYNRNVQSKNYTDDRNDNYRSSRHSNNDDDYYDKKHKNSKRESRSKERRRNQKSDSEIDTSVSSPEKPRHKSSKKSSKSKKSKKSKQRHNSSSEDEKKHKKKTKKSRKSRSRSRSRHRK